MHLVSQQEQYIQKALKVLDETRATGDKKPYDVKLTYQSVKATFTDPKAAESHAKSIRDMALKGLTDLFTIEKVIPYPLASIVSMALISLGQIALGCMLTASGGAQLGIALIRSGISDTITTIKSAIKGSFDWGAWAVQKGIEIVISVASAGITMAKEAMQGMQTAKTTATTLTEGCQSGTQAIKDIFGANVVQEQVSNNLTLTTAAGEAITKSPGQIVKDLLGIELKQTATGTLMNQAAQFCTDELLINRESERIRKAVRRDLTKAFTENQLIAKALELDRKQETTSWQECFLQEAEQVLNDKLSSSKLKEILTQIGQGVACDTVHYSKENEKGETVYKVGAQEVILVAKGVRALFRSTVGDIAPFTKKFLESFNTRIDTYKKAIEESQQAEQQTQQATVHSTQQATTMADAPPLDLDEAEIVVNKVDTIASFRAPDRNANQIKLEEHFSNLGPSTPENLVHQLETRICDHTIQQLHDAVKPIVSYGVHWANHQLYKKAIKENQAFLSALSNRGLRKYEANVEEKKQQKQDKEQKKAEGSSSHPQGNSQKETKQEAPKAAPFAEQARKEFEEGDPVTLSHMRVAGNCLSERPIHMYDANGKLLEAIGNYKSGEPIALRLVTDTKGNLSHIEPINLTDDQRKQHDSLDHTQNDCGLNALFVHLPKEKQAQVGDARGMRNFCADHMRKNPQRYDGLFKYEMRLSQMDPAQVPRAGCMEERLERQFGNDPNDTLFRHSLWMHNPDYQSAEWLCEAAKEQGDIESAQKWSQLCDTIAVEESERIKAEAPRTLFRGIMHMGQLASIFFGNPSAFRGFSMGLKGEQIFSDDLLREHVKNREMAGVWERGQDHLPLWGPVRNSARSLARKEYIRSILHAADFELDARLIRDLKGCSKPGGGGAVATKIPSQVKNILKNPESFKGAPAKNAMMEIDKHVPPHWIRDTARKGRGVRWYDPKNKGNSIMVEYGNKKSKDPTGLHKGPYLRITKNGEEIRVPLETNPVLMTE